MKNYSGVRAVVPGTEAETDVQSKLKEREENVGIVVGVVTKAEKQQSQFGTMRSTDKRVPWRRLETSAGRLVGAEAPLVLVTRLNISHFTAGLKAERLRST